MKNRREIIRAVNKLYENGLIDEVQVETIINNYLKQLQGGLV